MKATHRQGEQSQEAYNAPYWAKKFLLVGNAELAKDYPFIKKIIRRKTKMAITFFAVCAVIALWSKAASISEVRTNLSESSQSVSHGGSHFVITSLRPLTPKPHF